MTQQNDKPIVFAKFVEQDILSEMGRLLFYILNIFSIHGYRIKLFANIDFDGLEKDCPYIRLVESINNLEMVDAIPDNSQDMIYLFDKKDKACARKNWEKKYRVNFNIFSSYFWASFSQPNPIIIPYPMHPLHYDADLPVRLNTARSNKKKIRIFFSGDTEGYTRNRINYPTAKLTRVEIIDAILENMNNQIVLVSDLESQNNLLEGEYVQKCVIVENGKFRIDAKAWLETLSRSDFFLCPPGYVMPMCHNVIEAMAVGTIPIINYPEWLNPGLVDMENCIAFDSKADLAKKITEVLNMKREQIDEMRTRVIEYYQNNLDPAGFMKKLESNTDKEITLLMITDAHVAKNESKLNRHSILINGVPRFPSDIWKGFRHRLGI